jgi:hypothetical protein
MNNNSNFLGAISTNLFTKNANKGANKGEKRALKFAMKKGVDPS